MPSRNNRNNNNARAAPSPSGVGARVTVFLDKPRKLRFDLNALAKIEEIDGRNVFEGHIWSDLRSARAIRLVLWAGLLHEDPDLTLEQAGAMLDPANFREIGDALLRAWTFGQPTAEQQEQAVAAEDSDAASVQLEDIAVEGSTEEDEKNVATLVG